MALYTIADLHLPLGIDKPMDIFGKAWENYVERLAVKRFCLKAITIIGGRQ